MYETSKDSGVFVSNIYFSSNPSIGQRLHTLDEDLVIASYEDRTLPGEYVDDKIDILDSMIIHKTFANPKLEPSFSQDFAWYKFLIPLVVPMVVTTSLFVGTFAVIKLKKIPSRPYLVLELAGMLLFFGVPNLVSSLEFLPIIISQPEQKDHTFLIKFSLPYGYQQLHCLLQESCCTDLQ